MSLRFDESFIEKVRESSDLAQILSPYVELKRAGGNLVGLCPFPDHKEKTPSFSVSEAKQAYYCFGCKRGGNVYTFLQQVRGMSFPESVEFLADRAGIPLPVVAANPREEQARRAAKEEKLTFYKINRIAALHFQKNLRELPASHPLKNYLAKRGLRPETIEQFGLGFAPDTWDDLFKELGRHRVPPHVSEQLGLLKKRTSGTAGHYDLFRHRLMFPIVSATSEVIAFGGRVLDDSMPKYLNSPESPLFSKGKTLYGLHESSKFIRTEEEVIVVEGYMDFLALFQVGITNVVATLGTALTDDHAKVLGRLAKSVVVLFDGDSAGIEATERSLSVLLRAGLAPKTVQLPDRKDPDEFIAEKGVESLREMIRSSRDLYLATLARWMQDFKAVPSQQFALAERLGTLLGLVQNPSLRDLYIKESAERLRVTPIWLRGVLQNVQSKNSENTGKQSLGQTKLSSSSSVSTSVASPVRSPENQMARASTQFQSTPAAKNRDSRSEKSIPAEEVWLLNLALSSKELMDRIVQADVVSMMVSDRIRGLLETAVKSYRQSPEKFDSLPAILSTDPENASLVTRFLDRMWFESNESAAEVGGLSGNDKGKAIVEDCIRKVQERHLRARAKELATQLRDEKSPEAMKEFLEAVKARHSLHK